MDEDRTKDEIFAEALIQIIDNQIAIKKHLGVVRDTYEDCYWDREVMSLLRNIE